MRLGIAGRAEASENTDRHWPPVGQHLNATRFSTATTGSSRLSRLTTRDRQFANAVAA
jgi:hypothetical protein